MMTVNYTISAIQKKYDISLFKDVKLLRNPAIIYRILQHINAYVYTLFKKEIPIDALQKFLNMKAYKQSYLLMNDIIKKYILSDELLFCGDDNELLDLKNDIVSKKGVTESFLYFFILYLMVVSELLENKATDFIVDRTLLILVSNKYYACSNDHSAVIMYLISAIQFKSNLLDCLQIFNNFKHFCDMSLHFPDSERYINNTLVQNESDLDSFKFNSWNCLLELTFSHLPFFVIERNLDHTDKLSEVRLKGQFKDVIEKSTDITNKETWYRKFETGIQDYKKKSIVPNTVQQGVNQNKNLSCEDSSSSRTNNDKVTREYSEIKYQANKLQVYEKFQASHPHINVQHKINKLRNNVGTSIPISNTTKLKTKKTKNKNRMQIVIQYLLKYQKRISNNKLISVLFAFFALLTVGWKRYGANIYSVIKKTFS